MLPRALLLTLAGFTMMWGRAHAFEPSVNYMLQCMGCHTPDGGGEPGRVPSVRNTLVPLATTPAGRKFLIQVPGAAQSQLSDAELAEVLNWMITHLSAQPAPADLKKFTAAEVSASRRTVLTAVSEVRKQLLAGR